MLNRDFDSVLVRQHAFASRRESTIARAARVSLAKSMLPALVSFLGCASQERAMPPSAPATTTQSDVSTAEKQAPANEKPASIAVISRVWSIDEAMNEALAAHPRIASANADKVAALARVDAARVGFFPALGVSGEINRSTNNNFPGTLFPLQGLPAISGTTTTKSLDAPSNWQTGLSLWANWDILSLARQAAAVDVTLAQTHVTSAQLNVEELEVAYNAGDAFLLMLEAEEALRASRASVTRAETLVKMTKPLVEQTLRPGVDLSRAEAELAVARTTLAHTEQTRDTRRAALAIAMGHAGFHVTIAPGNLLEPIDEAAVPTFDPAKNPKSIEANATSERVGAAKDVVRAEFLPRVDLVAALFARGSGASTSPTANGLVPDTANWAAGIVVSWSVLDIPRISARARAASADYDASIARRDEVVLEVSGELETASAILKGATRVARETPLALASALAAEQQALARYQSSLAPLVDLADAERVLTQADVENAIARVEVRRALLLLARAAGDLKPFLSR